MANRKPGRPKGALNKENKALREMILGALDKVGGEDYLAAQAQERPQVFIPLLGRVLPMTVAGDPNNPVGLSLTVKLVGD